MTERQPDMIEVEEIIDKRFNPKKNITQYKVIWAGFTKEKATWMPVEELWLLPDLISAFQGKRTLQQELNDNGTQFSDKIKGQRMIGEKQICKIFDDEDQLVENSVIEQGKNDQTQKKGKTKQGVPFEDQDQFQSVNGQQSIKNRQSLKQTLQKVKQRVRPPPPPPPPPRDSKSFMFRDVPMKAFERQSQSRGSVMKTPPPLPPDFSTNKNKYLNLDAIKSKGISYTSLKHKIIQKDRNKYQNFQSRNQDQFDYDRKIWNRKNIQSELAQPIRAPRSIPPPPPRFINTGRYKQNQFETQQPQHQLQQSFYEPEVKKDQFNNNYNYYGTDEAQYKYETDTQYQYGQGQQSIDNSLTVYSILKMQNTEDGYMYSAQTSKGTLTMTRPQLFPKFAPQLVLFYEKFLTFQY